MTGTLYLLPCDLGPEAAGTQLAAPTREKLLSLRYFIAEEPRSARRYLAALGRAGLRELVFETLNEHTSAEALGTLLAPLKQGEDVGLISEAGCPAVADPGAELVALAHREGIRVTPMVGPSSILLALMASGLGGQRFTFLGYLPVEGPARRQALLDIEQASAQSGSTQIFIETPYRNEAMVADILAHCASETLLCLATDLTQSGESVLTRTVARWRDATPTLDRRPTVFALRAMRLPKAASLRPSAVPDRLPSNSRPRRPGSRRSGAQGVRRSSDAG